MPVFTDARLIAVLAAYEAGVDRALSLAERDEPDPDPADAEPTGERALPLRAIGAVGRTIRRRLAGTTYPRHPTWKDEPAHERAEWWAERISWWAAGPTALPWVAGKLSDRLPVKDALSAAAQGLVVCAVSREYGIDDADRRISLLAELLTGRRIEPARVAELRGTADPVQPAAAAIPADFDTEVDESVDEPKRGVVRRAGRALWSLARVVGEMEDLLDHRQKGHLAARMVGFLPVVGVVGGYVAEHTAMERTGRATEKLLRDRFGIATPTA